MLRTLGIATSRAIHPWGDQVSATCYEESCISAGWESFNVPRSTFWESRRQLWYLLEKLFQLFFVTLIAILSKGNTVCNDEAADVRWAVSQVLGQFSTKSLSPYLDIIDTWAATTRSKFHRLGHLSHCSFWMAERRTLKFTHVSARAQCTD